MQQLALPRPGTLSQIIEVVGPDYLERKLKPRLVPLYGLLSIHLPFESRGAPTEALLCLSRPLQPEQTPDRYRTDEVSFRSYYLSDMARFQAQAKRIGDHVLLAALAWEEQQWLLADDRRLARLYSKISVAGAPSDALSLLTFRSKFKDVCWLWRPWFEEGWSRARAVSNVPVVDLGKSKNVAVHRLLWTRERTSDPIDRFVRPARNPQMCESKACVNPHHFIYAADLPHPVDPTARSAGNWSSTGKLPAYKYFWRALDAIPDPTGVFDKIVICKHRGHRLSVATQLKLKTYLDGRGGLPYGRGHCPECFAERRKLGPVGGMGRRKYSGGTRPEPILHLEDERKRAAEIAEMMASIPKAPALSEPAIDVNLVGLFDDMTEDSPA